MRERLIGPVRGYYLVASCLVAGELADRYRGWGRAYRTLPGSLLDSGHVVSVQAEAEHLRAEEALNEAEDLLVDAVEELPELPAPPPSAAEAGLLRVAYVSRAARHLRPADLERLLAGARARNAAHGVTGALVYFDETFLQFLEGPANRVHLIYRRIRQDPLHAGVIKLLAQPAEHRVFDGWDMAFQMQGSQTAASGAVLSGPAIHALLMAFVDRASARGELHRLAPADEVLADRVPQLRSTGPR